MADIPEKPIKGCLSLGPSEGLTFRAGDVEFNVHHDGLGNVHMYFNPVGKQRPVAIIPKSSNQITFKAAE